jgi:hypothetical protein
MLSYSRNVARPCDRISIKMKLHLFTFHASVSFLLFLFKLHVTQKRINIKQVRLQVQSGLGQ